MKALPFLPAALMAGFTLAASTALAYRPAGPHAVAAVFPPWWTGAAIAQAAGSAGLILAMGAMRNVVILRADLPGVPERAMAAGALFVMPGAAPGCATD